MCDCVWQRAGARAYYLPFGDLIPGHLFRPNMAQISKSQEYTANVAKPTLPPWTETATLANLNVYTFPKGLSTKISIGK